VWEVSTIEMDNLSAILEEGEEPPPASPEMDVVALLVSDSDMELGSDVESLDGTNKRNTKSNEGNGKLLSCFNRVLFC
jgi:hypothetical protein